MEKLNKVKSFFLGILTFIFMLILVVDIVLFSVKKISEKYLQEEKIKEIINNINIVDLFKDENGKEIEQFTEIKNKIVDSGIPKESIDAFIESKPVNDYATETITKAVNNVINTKQERLIDAKGLYVFLEENIDDISKELQDKDIPKSEYLTKENQQIFLNKVKEKTPDIEQKIEEVSAKINEKIGFDYNEKLEKGFKMFKLFYTKIADIILVLILMIFVMGIFITRQSFYKSLKWIGITFIISGNLLYLFGYLIPKLYKYIDKIPEGFKKMVREVCNDLINSINNYGLIYFVIGIILIIINIVVYYILLKKENKKFESIG